MSENAPQHHLAQFNIGRVRAPIGDPLMAGFVAQLDDVNALADGAPGFVWRLQTEEGNATSIHAFEDERLLLNMSVWTSVEALRNFAYAGRHLELLRDRAEWFEGATGPYQVLWWLPAGHTPTLEEAKRKLECLEVDGPTAEAFTFQQLFSSAEPEVTTVGERSGGTR